MQANIQNLLTKVIKKLDHVIQPPKFVTDEDEIRQILITKSVLIFAILANVLAAIVFLNPSPIVFLLAMSGLFLLLHTQHYRLVPNLVVISSILIVLGSSLLLQSTYILFFVISGLLVSVVLCNFRDTVLHSILAAIGMGIVVVLGGIPMLQYTISISQLLTWGFIGIGFTLFIAFIRHRDVQHLSEQRTRYRALLSGTQDLIFRVNHQGMQTDVFVPDWMPFDPQVTTNVHLNEVLPEEVANEYLMYIETSLETKSVVRYQYQAENEMGLRDYESSIVPLVTDEVIFVVRDVTDLRSKEQRLRNLLATSPDFVFAYDVESRDHTFYNRPEFMGYTPHDLQLTSLTTIVHPDYQKRARQQLDAERADTENNIFNEEYYYRVKDSDDWAWVRRRSIVSSRYPDGRPKEILVTLSNITEQKLRDLEQRRNEQKILSLIKHSTDGIILVDEEGLVAEWNQGMMQITGRVAEGVIGTPIWDVPDLFLPSTSSDPELADSNRLKEKIQLYFETGEPFWQNPVPENRINRKNHISRIIQPVIFPIQTENGFMLGSIMRDVTQQRETEKALEANQERHRLLMEVNPDLMFWVNRQGYYTDVYIPPDWHTQIPKEQIIGKNIQVNFSDEVTAKIMEKIVTALDTGEMQYAEYQLTEVIGLRDYEARIVPAANDEVISIARDVTERKQAERALAEESQLLQTVIDAIPTSIFVKDRDHRFLRANQEHTMLHGQNVIGKTDRDFSHLTQEMIEKFWADEELVVNEGISLRSEESVLDSEQNFHWLYTIKVPLKNEANEIYGVVGISTDITELKKTQDKLAASEQRLRSLLNSLPVTLTTIDQQRKIRSIYSAQSPQLFGHNVDSLVSQHIDSILPQDDRAIAIEQIQQVFETGEIARFPIQFEHDNQTRWYENQIASLETDFPMKHATIITVDVTERKQAEQKALQVDIEKQRTAILSKFIQSASHEFRTPLSIIQSSAYLLANSNNADKHEKRLHMIDEKVADIATLVDNMALMASLDSLLSLDIKAIKLSLLLRQLEVTLRHTNKDNIFIFELAADLPTIYGDEYYLILALNRIIDNAIHFSAVDSPITLRANQENGYVVIEIQDEGTGMPPDVMEHIFERFYRADPAQTARGFGLGLPIAQKIIELHQGTIMAESEMEIGSTFTIVLPIQHKP